MDNELMNLALLSSPNEMLEAARYVFFFHCLIDMPLTSRPANKQQLL